MQGADYCDELTFPYTRLRVFIVTKRGDVQKFTLQLEYDLNPEFLELSQWVPIARFDHNPRSDKGHDVRQEGLHMDILDANNTKHDVFRGFPEIPDELSLCDAPAYCENYLRKHEDVLTARFEKRNGIDGLHYPP